MPIVQRKRVAARARRALFKQLAARPMTARMRHMMRQLRKRHRPRWPSEAEEHERERERDLYINRAL